MGEWAIDTENILIELEKEKEKLFSQMGKKWYPFVDYIWLHIL